MLRWHTPHSTGVEQSMQFLREDDRESKVCRESYLSNVKEVTLKNSQNMKSGVQRGVDSKWLWHMGWNTVMSDN